MKGVNKKVAIYEITIKKKKGEDIIPDIINIIHDKLNDDPAFVSLVVDPVPNRGVSDEGKPYVVFVGENSAIVVLRENDNKVLISFIKTPLGLRQIDDMLRNRYKIFLFRGRTAPFELAIKQHILQLITEEPEMDEGEEKEEKDEKDEAESGDGGDKKDRADTEKDELEEDVERIFGLKQ